MPNCHFFDSLSAYFREIPKECLASDPTISVLLILHNMRTVASATSLCGGAFVAKSDIGRPDDSSLSNFTSNALNK